MTETAAEQQPGSALYAEILDGLAEDLHRLELFSPRHARHVIDPVVVPSAPDPETGEPGIFGCVGYIVGLEGMEQEEATALLLELLHGLRAHVVYHAFVAVAQQAPHHVCAHPAQPDHADLHG